MNKILLSLLVINLFLSVMTSYEIHKVNKIFVSATVCKD